MYPAKDSVYIGTHPVFVSHTKEIEQMLYFTGDLKYQLQVKGQAPGEKYNCLLRVRAKCADLLLRMYAEDSDIILLDDTDMPAEAFLGDFSNVHTVDPDRALRHIIKAGKQVAHGGLAASG